MKIKRLPQLCKGNGIPVRTNQMTDGIFLFRELYAVTIAGIATKGHYWKVFLRRGDIYRRTRPATD